MGPSWGALRDDMEGRVPYEAGFSGNAHVRWPCTQCSLREGRCGQSKRGCPGDPTSEWLWGNEVTVQGDPTPEWLWGNEVKLGAKQMF